MFTPSANLCPFNAQNGAQIISDLRGSGVFIGDLINRVYKTGESRPEYTESDQILTDLLPIVVDAINKDHSQITALCVSLITMAVATNYVSIRNPIDALQMIESHIKSLTEIAEGIVLDRVK